MMVAMKTGILALVLFSFTLSASAQEKPERAMNLGYTTAQIVAMGEEKFAELFDKKYSSSTAAMIDMEISYAWAVEFESNKLLAKMSPETQSVYKSVKADMQLAGENSSQVQMAFAGGGSMYNIFHVASKTRAEVTVYNILKGKKSKTATLAEVESKYQKVKALVLKAEPDLKENEQFSNLKFEDVAKMVEEMHLASTRSAETAKSLSSAQKGAIMKVFYDAFDNILIENSGE